MYLTIRLCIRESRVVTRGTMGAVAVEKLTPERRRELTRNALLDAAEEVFARRGFE